MEAMIKNPKALPSGLHSGWWASLWRALPAVRVRRAPRRLRLCESLSLGEKRLVAVIQYEDQKFLVGGGAGSVALLARLDGAPEFSELLTQWCERQR
ncbi:MAG: flagellar biosynthetic protein FliO [Candidatus Korobacteraceae bacterium]|jgi:flagellar biogenesis protein FliO